MVINFPLKNFCNSFVSDLFCMLFLRGKIHRRSNFFHQEKYGGPLKHHAWPKSKIVWYQNYKFAMFVKMIKMAMNKLQQSLHPYVCANEMFCPHYISGSLGLCWVIFKWCVNMWSKSLVRVFKLFIKCQITPAHK